MAYISATMTTNQFGAISLGVDPEIKRKPLIIGLVKASVESGNAWSDDFSSTNKLKNMSLTDNYPSDSELAKLFTVSSGTATLNSSNFSADQDIVVPLFLSSAVTAVDGFNREATTSETQLLDGSETPAIQRDGVTWSVELTPVRTNAYTLPYFVAPTTTPPTDPAGLKSRNLTYTRLMNQVFDDDVTIMLYLREDVTKAPSVTNPEYRGLCKATLGPGFAAEAGTTGLQTYTVTLTGQDNPEIRYE